MLESPVVSQQYGGSWGIVPGMQVARLLADVCAVLASALIPAPYGVFDSEAIGVVCFLRVQL